jgi:dephospho-CoA kinase
MKVIGLTGGIASGKTTVSALFQESGIPVICTDEIAHFIVRPGSDLLRIIQNEFGQEIITPSGNLDRSRLAELVFQDPLKRSRLEQILHPRIREETVLRLAQFKESDQEYVIVDVPLLYESKWTSMFDCVILVYVPRELQEQRLIQRNGLSVEESNLRIGAQMDIELKKHLATIIIDNSQDLELTRDQVSRLVLTKFQGC